MPPKPRFTREEIVDAALALVSEKGIGSLTARELANRLGTSSQPIFTVFADMDELRGAVVAAALKRMNDFVQQSAKYTHSFKQAGIQIIHFAKEEPKLFQLLLMSEAEEPMSFEDMLLTRGGPTHGFIELVSDRYELTTEEAKALFMHTWVYTYGIGVLCASKICTFEEDELIELIGADFQAMLAYIKAGHLNDQTPVPQPVGAAG